MTPEQINEKRAELAALLAEIEDDHGRQLLRDVETRQSRRRRLLLLQREIAMETGEEYAEPLPLGHVLADEWHIVSNFGRDTVVICGDVGVGTALVIRFQHTEQFRVGTPRDQSEGSTLSGLGFSGLFVVRNSLWKRAAVDAVRSTGREIQDWISGLEHFVLRNQTELSCLARGYEVRVVHQSIESLREAASFWKQLT